MVSSRPYLIKALLEWIVDCEKTPYILVNADVDGVVVPRKYVKNGKVTLNISSTAAQALTLTNEYLSFTAYFQGKKEDIYVPVLSVAGIYAQETGQGMVFDETTIYSEPEKPAATEAPVRKGPPSLSVVK